MKLTDRPDLREAALHFEASAKASRMHQTLVSILLKRHGDGDGRQISGVIREHFPEAGKETLRKLCAKICAENDIAMAYRPKGVWLKTMHKLGREIAKRDGTGFYGFKV